MPNLTELLLGRTRTPDLPDRPELFRQPAHPPTPEPVNRDVRLTDPGGRFSGLYDSHLIQELAQAATRFKEDPWTVLAMGLQESTLGKRDQSNPLSLVWSKGAEPPPWETFLGLPEAASRSALIDESLKKWQELKGYLPNTAPEVLQIQSYNGLGRVPAGQYGQSVATSGRHDRPYGHRIIELREQVLKPNPAIQELVRRVSPR
jgi:hypothetical protein